MARRPSPRYWPQRDLWHCIIKGDRVILARGRENREEAEKAFHRAMLARGEGTGHPTPTLNVRDLCGAFLTSVGGKVKRGERSPLTLEQYVRCLKPLVRDLGTIPAGELRPVDVNRVLSSRGWGPTNANNVVTVLKAAYSWAHREGIIQENPIARLAKPTPRQRDKIPSTEVIQKALEAIPEDDPFRNFILVLWSTGCRPGELAGLTAERVNLSRGAFQVEDKIRHRTGRKYRTVRHPAVVGPVLERLCRAHPEGPIFRTGTGKPWQRWAWVDRFAKLREQIGAGPELTAYGLRHRFGTDLAGSGVSAVIVAAAMGHRDTRTTVGRYVHPEEWDDRVIRDAVERGRGGVSIRKE